MADPHARFEEYALAHVLGGLPHDEAALFRTHLADCRDCRLRVAELRDLAEDLASAEREERRRTSVATRVAQASDDGDGDDDRWFLSPPRWAQVVAVVVLVAVLGILFWNYHLRRVTSQYADAVARQSSVLAVLAEGEPIEVDGDRGVRGVAAIDDRTLAADLTGLPEPADGQVLVAWFLDRDGEVIGRSPLAVDDGGGLPFTSEVDGATTLLVTLEDGAPGDEPGGLRLAEMELPAR